MYQRNKRRYRTLGVAIIITAGTMMALAEDSERVQSSITPDLLGETRMHHVVEEWQGLFKAYLKGGPSLKVSTELMARTEEAFKESKPTCDDKVEQFVRACYAVSAQLTSVDMGAGNERFRLCQIITAGCLPYLDALPDQLAMQLVSQMSPQLDLDARPLNAKSLSVYRNTYVERRLRLWHRILSRIDDKWDPSDPANTVTISVSPRGGNYLPGTPPERIREPEIRNDYERRIAENDRRAKRNTEQIESRQNRDRWLQQALRRDIVQMYRVGRVTEDDADVLKAYLRVYVSDEKLRKELFEIAQSAAKGNRVE